MVKEHEFFKDGLPTIRYGVSVPDDAINIAFVSSPKLNPEENLFISNFARFNKFTDVWTNTNDEGYSYVEGRTSEFVPFKQQPQRIDERVRINENGMFYKAVLMHEVKSNNPYNIKILDVLKHPVTDLGYSIEFVQVSSGNYKAIVYLQRKQIVYAEYKAVDGDSEIVIVEKLSIEPVNNIRTTLYETRKLKVFNIEYDVYVPSLKHSDIYLQQTTLFGDMKVYYGR